MESAGRPHFGALLRQFRLDAGMTQQELAERANLSVEAISTLERGARTRPYRETVVLARARARIVAGTPGASGKRHRLAHPARQRERSEALNASLLRLVRPDAASDAETQSPGATDFLRRTAARGC